LFDLRIVLIGFGYSSKFRPARSDRLRTNGLSEFVGFQIVVHWRFSDQRELAVSVLVLAIFVGS
jgi:hypothetical protein